MASPHPDLISCNERASDWMHRGINLLNARTPESLEGAVRCFDEAIALRRTLPLAENAQYRYGLAAGWVNRGDALQRLGGKERWNEAIQSYDEALVLVRSLPLAENPLYPRRLAITLINRGITLQLQDSPTSRIEAVGSFREALAVLEDSRSAAISDLVVLQAGTLCNLAGALPAISAQSTEEQLDLSLRALKLVKETERTDASAAQVGFQARRRLCCAVADESHDGKSIPSGRLEMITDTVDEGLALARHWKQHGESFSLMTEDLFRFGCRIYQTNHPHFLAEFILENLDPRKTNAALPLNQDTHYTAVAALWGALKEIQRDGFAPPSSPRFARLLENLRTLRVTEERLDQLRRTASA